MANNLQPPSVINDLRTKTHLALSARLQNLDLTPLLVMMLGNNVPASILPYLIWQFDMMVPAAPMQALGVSPLTIIQNALPLHAKLGTPWALKQALTLCGFPDASLLEGQNSWGGTDYPANVGWAVFRVALGASAAGKLYSQQAGGNTDGANRNFTMPVAPQPPDDLRVFYNGALQAQNLYEASGADFTMGFTPLEGSSLGVALATSPITPAVLGYLTQVCNWFRPATRYLDAVVAGFPQFFDAIAPTVEGNTLVLPQAPSSIELYRNGAYQTQGIDFTLNGETITPTLAPLETDSFLAWGTYGASTGNAPSFANWVTPQGNIDGVNKVFILPQSPNPAASLKQYLNWQILAQGAGADYTLEGQTLTYKFAPPVGSTHFSFYRF